jgi:hypothetical protein
LFLLYILFCFFTASGTRGTVQFYRSDIPAVHFSSVFSALPMTSPCCGAGKGENMCVLRRRARAGFSPASPNKYSISFLFIYGNKNAGISQMPAISI